MIRLVRGLLGVCAVLAVGHGQLDLGSLGLHEGPSDSAEIVDLPGLSFTPTFKHYSGFLKASDTRYLHYW